MVNEKLENDLNECDLESEEMRAESINPDEVPAEEACEGTGDALQAAETENAEEDSENSQVSEKKGLFGKKKEKKDKKDIKIEELTDRLQRQMAEFDNFRKRTEKEKSSMYEIGSRSVIEKILPIIDNFERGLAAVPEDQEKDAFVEGMEMVYKQLMDSLEEIDVKPIEAVGQEFDPNLHNAVMHIEDEEAGNNTIVEEFQKGYTFRESVIRYSMVKVAN